MGALAEHEKELVNTGVAHTQTDEGDIYLNQDKYIVDLRPIRSPSMSRHSMEEECKDELHLHHLQLDQNRKMEVEWYGYPNNENDSRISDLELVEGWLDVNGNRSIDIVDEDIASIKSSSILSTISEVI